MAESPVQPIIFGSPVFGGVVVSLSGENRANWYYVTDNGNSPYYVTDNGNSPFKVA